MFETIYTGWSGIVSNSTAISVTGNNLANMNTVGFKRSAAGFHQLMTDMGTRSGNGNPLQIGLGSRTAAISPIFTQGNLTETGLATNVALQGSGFFQVAQGDRQYFTRAGNFGLNSDGQLVTPAGAIVQGYSTRDASGNIITTGTPGDIVVDFAAPSPPKATDLVRYITNLSATSEPGEVVTSELEIYDANGQARTLKLHYTNTDTPGQWDYSFEVEGGEVTNGTGTLTFDTNGKLASLNGQDVTVAGFSNPVISLTGLDNGAADMDVTWDMVQPGATAGSANTTLITNYAAQSVSSTVHQNGNGSGELESITFNQDGVLMGYYSNGDSVQMAKLALATFTNNQGLKQVGNGYFQQTTASGAANLDGATGTRFLGGTLETSNVDVANEFVDLIFNQRAYQGNTRSVTTSNQIIQEILGLKR